MKALTPEKFIEVCIEEWLQQIGCVRYTPSRCHHGIPMYASCVKCLRENDAIMGEH